jgi:hypothetical protein
MIDLIRRSTEAPRSGLGADRSAYRLFGLLSIWLPVVGVLAFAALGYWFAFRKDNYGSDFNIVRPMPSRLLAGAAVVAFTAIVIAVRSR